jgi:hypothetical protein
MNFIAEWKNVEKDGLPEPDSNKTYFVLYDNGCGFGKYNYDTEIIRLKEPNQFGYRFELFTKKEKRWWLDFDGIGHENTVIDYFEIIYPEDCKKENNN